jgi:hypothetical protein
MIISGIFNIIYFQAKNYELSESLAKVKEENKFLSEKLREAEEKAQMAKNEVKTYIKYCFYNHKWISQFDKFIMESCQKEEELANVIAILKKQRHVRVPLPLELNCQIFECLKFGIQRKFIGGLGRGIYAIFRQKVLTKVA